jgi:hypothetical protein
MLSEMDGFTNDPNTVEVTDTAGVSYKGASVRTDLVEDGIAIRDSWGAYQSYIPYTHIKDIWTVKAGIIYKGART